MTKKTKKFKFKFKVGDLVLAQTGLFEIIEVMAVRGVPCYRLKQTSSDKEMVRNRYVVESLTKKVPNTEASRILYGITKD